MNQPTSHLLPLILRGVLGCATGLSALGCGSSATPTSGTSAPLTASCVPDGTTAPTGSWSCPERRVVECAVGGADVDTLYVHESTLLSCASDTPRVSDSGPFGPGLHTISVHNSANDEVCAAQLQVVDRLPPELTVHTLQMWPPNHKLHAIAVHDCVSALDACDGELQGEFIWGSSDEPVDDIGDGHHAPDIVFDDCEHVSLRSERQGPKNGRVYKLGVRVSDRAGHVEERECVVIVDHDQRGVQGADDGEAYRIVLNGTGGALSCGNGSDEADAGLPAADSGVTQEADSGLTAEADSATPF